MSTKTGFENEAKGNSEIAYYRVFSWGIIPGDLNATNN